MLGTLREHFMAEFLQSARRRVALALELLASGRPEDAHEASRELHALGGEAGLIGLAGVRVAAVEGENSARRLAVSSDGAERVSCARAVRAVARAVEALEPLRTDAGLSANQAERGTAKRRALIVDDSALSASLLREVLERAGFEV